MQNTEKSKDQFVNDLKQMQHRVSELEELLSKSSVVIDELRKSEEKYRTVAEFTYDWEDWLDPSGKYLYVSPSCERITGYKRENFVSPEFIVRITHPDDSVLVKEHFHEILNQEIEPHHLDFRIINRDGQMRWISHYCHTVFGEKGTFLGTRGSNRDITQRKETEQKLEQMTEELKRFNRDLQIANNKLKSEIAVREKIQDALEISEDRYKRMVSAVTAYTYSVQIARGQVIYTEHSMGCLPITGYSPDDYRSDPNLWYSMIYPDDKTMVQRKIDEIMRGEKVVPFEHRIIRRDRAVIWIRNTIIPYYSEDGALVKYDGLIEDITERKLAEIEIQKLNRELEQKLLELTDINKELEAFNRSVSHDLQTPLMVIAGFAHRFLKDHGDKIDSDAIDMMNIIQMSVQKMEKLIKDLIAFSRSGRQEIKAEQIEMRSLVITVIDELKPLTEGRTINYEIDDLPSVFADFGLIKQVITNLLSNAIKFTQTKDIAVIEVGYRIEKNEHIYWVKDNGIGFYPQYADKIFSTFYRLPEAKEYHGTGIGLSIVQRIIHRHGGRVWAEGQENEGATFYFALPNMHSRNLA